MAPVSEKYISTNSFIGKRIEKMKAKTATERTPRRSSRRWRLWPTGLPRAGSTTSCTRMVPQACMYMLSVEIAIIITVAAKKPMRPTGRTHETNVGTVICVRMTGSVMAASLALTAAAISGKPGPLIAA